MKYRLSKLITVDSCPIAASLVIELVIRKVQHLVSITDSVKIFTKFLLSWYEAYRLWIPLMTNIGTLQNTCRHAGVAVQAFSAGVKWLKRAPFSK